MNKPNSILLISTLLSLFACTTSESPKKQPESQVVKAGQKGYLKEDISQAELYNPVNYKRYYYNCRNFETGATSFLSSYFPLSRESRLKDNFGFYFQLDGGKVEPFDHIENKALNKKGTRFQVIYRSYNPIQGSYIDLIAGQNRSTYYKNYQGVRTAWLECREA